MSDKELDMLRKQDHSKTGQEGEAPAPVEADLPRPRHTLILRGAGNAAIQRYMIRLKAAGNRAGLLKIHGLKLSQPGDWSEREAHQVAQQVTRMPAPEDSQPAAHPAVEGGAPRPEAIDPSLSSGGQPLDDASRAYFEPRLGADLSQVRVHTGDQAGQSAQEMDALAYTIGRDVVFAPGQYDPNSNAGKEILAHELTHVVQQGGAGTKAGAKREASSAAPHISRTGERMVQRWDSPEHVELGETAAGPSAGLITLECHDRDFPQRNAPMSTWPKDWLALYTRGTPEQQRAITKGLTYGEIIALSGDFYADFNALNDAPLREIYDLIPLIRGKATTTQLQEATGGRYLALAKVNESHFSNVSSGHSNREVWRDMHIQAIQAAKAGSDNLAWGINAAADHFLTDAFSGGHIRTPRAALMGKMGGLGDLQSKILHDLDNEHGVEVANDRGDQWIAYGDDFLTDPRNAANRRLAIEAVQLSRLDIANAISQRSGYPAPDAHTVFAAEKLIPCPVDPTKDRWTGRAPTYTPGPFGPVRKEDDYTRTRDRVLRDEAPGFVAGFFNDDDQVRDWVNKQTLPAIGRQPEKEKIRMIDTLLSGWITGTDLAAIERICGSVTSKAEADAIRKSIDLNRLTDLGDRTRMRVILAKMP